MQIFRYHLGGGRGGGFAKRSWLISIERGGVQIDNNFLGFLLLLKISRIVLYLESFFVRFCHHVFVNFERRLLSSSQDNPSIKVSHSVFCSLFHLVFQSSFLPMVPRGGTMGQQMDFFYSFFFSFFSFFSFTPPTWVKRGVTKNTLCKG